jgi:predicted Zn-dependent protease
VWADDAYRAQNLHWQQIFEDQIEHANEVLGGMFGVRLVAELRSWSRAAPDATLEDSLTALAERDPGDDVLAVIGLTSSLSIVAATFEKLGVAELGGRHMVLRGYADLEERKIFDRVFTELRAEEREVLYDARRRHKKTSLVLHELGHNLGADHVADEGNLMSASYSEHAAAFDPHSRAVMLASFDRYLKRGPAGAVGPAPDAKPAVKAPSRIVLDVDANGKIRVNGAVLDDAQVDALFAGANHTTEVIVRYGKYTPPDARNAVIARAQGLGCRVSFVRY